MFVKNTSTEFDQLFKWNTIIMTVMLINFLYCFTAILVDKKKFIAAIIEVLTAFPVALVLSLGMSYHNTRAILQGIKGKKTAFIRTPKVSESGRINPYLKTPGYKKYIPEFLLFLYFLFAASSGIYFKDFGFLIYHVLMLSGFGFILWSAWSETSEN